MKKVELKKIPNNLRKYRKAVGLKQKDIARIPSLKNCGMISRWEKSVCLPAEADGKSQGSPAPSGPLVDRDGFEVSFYFKPGGIFKNPTASGIPGKGGILAFKPHSERLFAALDKILFCVSI